MHSAFNGVNLNSITFNSIAAPKDISTRQTGYVAERTKTSPSGSPAVQPESTPAALAERFDKAWHVAQLETHRRIRRLSPEMRPLLELQSEVQRLGLQTNLAAQAAEAVSSTLRRLQQMGGS